MADKVLLVRPENVYHYNNYPPLNLICLGSRLAAAGFDAKILNTALEGDPLEAIEREARDALLVGVTILTAEAPDALRILKHVKAACNVPTVVGGWHCTLFPEQMAACEYVDYVVAGEGESHLLTIAEALRDGRTPETKIFPKEPLDLDALPAPDYDLDGRLETFVSGYLTDKLSDRVRRPMRWLPYESSRGCPSKCTFCINVVTGNQRYRKRSAENVVADVVAIVGKYRLTHVKFVDDNFFVDIERIRAIARGLIDAGLDITWDAECRCDYFNDRMINDETLDLTRRSGLVQLTLGIESGAQHTLDLMKKGITPEQAEHAVAQCNAHGITPRSSFIVEIPGETLKDIKATIAFINRLRKYELFVCGVNMFRPYPRCELTTSLIADGYLEEPKTFEAWTDREAINVYTAAEYIRPWQAHGRYSQNACLYLNMESARTLRNTALDRWIDRARNSLFIGLAKFRNRLKCYALPVDGALYQRFVRKHYKQRQQRMKAGGQEAGA